MKKEKQVLQEHPDFQPLIKAVLFRIGKEDIPQVIENGIAAGFGGFISIEQCRRFVSGFNLQIARLLIRDVNDSMRTCGEILIGGSFFEGNPMSAEESRGVHDFLFGGIPDSPRILKALAWFAADTVCNWFKDDQL